MKTTNSWIPLIKSQIRTAYFARLGTSVFEPYKLFGQGSYYYTKVVVLKKSLNLIMFNHTVLTQKLCSITRSKHQKEH